MLRDPVGPAPDPHHRATRIRRAPRSRT